MQDERLLQIDHTLTSINPQTNNSQSQPLPSSIYTKAIRDLRDVHDQITSIKTRIGNIMLKHNKSTRKHKTIDDYDSRRKRFFEEVNQQRINLERIKACNEAELRKIYVDKKKQDIVKKLQRARRTATEARFRTHDLVKEHSLQNLRKIQEIKREELKEKQQKHDQLYQKSKKHKQLMRNVQKEKQKQIKRFCELSTQKVKAKIVQKTNELIKIEQQCVKYERKLNNMHLKNIKTVKTLRKDLLGLTNPKTERASNPPKAAISDDKSRTIQ